MTESDLRARQALSDMGRIELEDKYLRLLEETFVLKKHARSQEDKMKRMATKLLRLTADEKKEVHREIHPLTTSQLRQRDVQTEEYIAELQHRMRELEKQNSSLKGKNMVLRQQVEAQGKRHTPYDHVQSRISTGIKRKRPPSATSSEPMPIKKPIMASVGVQFAGSCHNLLEGVRRDNQDLESQLLQFKAELLDKDAENNSVKEKLRLKSMQLEEEKLVARQELQTQIASLEREKTDQEMDVIRLQREVRDASNRLQTMRTKCTATEQNLEILRTTHSKVLDEMEGLNMDLKRERHKATQLEMKLTGHETTKQALRNLEVVVEDLKQERNHLREASRDITHKDELYVAKHKATATALQEQVNILQEAASVDSADRGKALRDLAAERELSSRLDEELRNMRDTYSMLKIEYEALKEKLKFFEKESSLDWSEVEEALTVVRDRKTKGLDSTPNNTSDMKELQDLRMWHADTVNELDKTRKLLHMQHTINKDYKTEVESLKRQLTEQRQKFEGQLQEFVQLMDIKAARVKKLEGQLKEIAYGTRSYRLDTSKFEYGGGEGGVEEGESEVHLERGQNLLQFHISVVDLSPEALSCLSTSTPALFVTFNFSDYETQVTPVLQGPRPNFSYTVNFVVSVDDSFLQHLQKSCIQLEVNQAMGLKYQLVAVASVKCWEVVTSAGGKVHGKAVLVGAESIKECVGVGGVEYWMCLKLPITQAAKLHQDRSKALASLKTTPTTTPTSLPPPQGPDYNELSITVIKCQGLPTKDPVHSPSPYVMYKLYSFPDQDTPIISNSCTPNFTDQHTFPLSMDAHLDHYLRTESLELYVFNDDDHEEVEPRYLGVAQVPLLPLSQGKPITGTFQLKQPSGESGGFVELSMKWKQPYNIHPDPPPKTTPSQMVTTPLPTTPSSPPKAKKLADPQSPPSSLPATTSTAKEPSKKLKEKTAKTPQPPPSATPPSGTSSGRKPPSKSSKNADSAQLGSQGSDSGVELAKPEFKNSLPPLKSSLPPLKGSLPPLGKIKPETPALSIADTKGKVIAVAPSTEDDQNVPAAGGSRGVEGTDVQVGVLDIQGAGGVGVTGVRAGVQSEGTDVQVGVLSVQGPGVAMTGVKAGVLGEGAAIDISIERPGGGDSGALTVDLAVEGGSELGSSLVSVTVTELSEEEGESVEEELEGDSAAGDDEDTMFEETLTNASGNDLSGISEHSSDLRLSELVSSPQQAQGEGGKATSLKQGEGETESDMTPSASDSEPSDSNPITSAAPPKIQQKAQEKKSSTSNTMSITITSFTLEPGSSLAYNDSIKNIFIEYQFLNCDYGELETPSSALPQEGTHTDFNFKKIFSLDSEQFALLTEMLTPDDPSDGKIIFTLVSDPEDQEADCEELGTAAFDLNMILRSGRDAISEIIDVMTLDEDPETIGHMTVSVEALQVLRTIKKHC